jgi:mRNA-degrading endonuclease RelE of RelBE toxin-antitoxin system
MKKMITVIEFPPFLSQVGKSIEPEERDDVVDFLARSPEAGDPIPGTGGIRKLRWAGKGKGKRGGLRIIYYFYNETAPVFLLTVYGKGEQEDLTNEQKARMVDLTSRLKAECKAVRRKHHD